MPASAATTRSERTGRPRGSSRGLPRRHAAPRAHRLVETVVASAGEGIVVYDPGSPADRLESRHGGADGPLRRPGHRSGRMGGLPRSNGTGVGEDLRQALGDNAPTSREFEYVIRRPVGAAGSSRPIAPIGASAARSWASFRLSGHHGRHTKIVEATRRSGRPIPHHFRQRRRRRRHLRAGRQVPGGEPRRLPSVLATPESSSWRCRSIESTRRLMRP